VLFLAKTRCAIVIRHVDSMECGCFIVADSEPSVLSSISQISLMSIKASIVYAALKKMSISSLYNMVVMVNP
jgi:hypothetical protein